MRLLYWLNVASHLILHMKPKRNVGHANRALKVPQEEHDENMCDFLADMVVRHPHKPTTVFTLSILGGIVYMGILIYDLKFSRSSRRDSRKPNKIITFRNVEEGSLEVHYLYAAQRIRLKTSL